MKLLFLETPISKTLESLFATEHIAVLKAGFEKEKEIDLTQVDAVIVTLSEASDLDHLRSIKARAERCWLVAIVARPLLEKAEFRKQLWNNPDKDEVWLAEQWELTFGFFVQTFYRRQHVEQELGDKVETLVKQLERDVELAAVIQKALLPKKTPVIPGVDISVRYIPASGGGGDYYDIFEFGDKKKFGVLIADSKTHGMAASLLSVLVKIRLDEMKERFTDTKGFVTFLNHEIRSVHEKEMSELSLIYGVIDRASLTFQYTSAGQLAPILCRLGEPQEFDSLPNPPLGSVDNPTLHENTLRLQPGDRLLFFTDGWQHLFKGNARAEIHSILQQHAKHQQEGESVEVELMGAVDRAKEKDGIKDDLTLIQFSIGDRIIYLAPKSTQKG